MLCAINLSRHDYLFLMQGEGSGILLLPSLSVHVFTFRPGYYYYYYYYVTISVLRQGLLQLQAGVSANGVLKDCIIKMYRKYLILMKY